MNCKRFSAHHGSFICKKCQSKIFRLGNRSYHLTMRLRNELPIPSTAPKASIDVKHIRENTSLHERNCLERNYELLATYPKKICDMANQWQSCQMSSRNMRERSNLLTRQLASSIPSDNDTIESEKINRQTLLNEARSLKEKLSGKKTEQAALSAEINLLAMALPNLISDYTPRGKVPRQLGLINENIGLGPSSTQGWRSHVDIGRELNLIDFTSATTTSGWGWYYLLNEAAQLEQALVQFALSVAKKRGWSLVSPPSMVYSHIADLCGFQPRDHNNEQQIYHIQQNTADSGRKPQLSLAGTAEIPLASMKANHIFEADDLPLKYVGVSRCYRAEAGARGAHTKGLYRVHEFTKVEMFAWTLPDSETSDIIFDEMNLIQREILSALKLHCRILEMPSCDLGASSTRKIDIEAFFPSRQDRAGGWGEVTSVSSCTDYQTRRLATQIRSTQSGRGDKLLFPYTLNGTALAIPRVLAALLENGWIAERKAVAIPQVLWPWMDGLQFIEKSRQ